jgi:hypothetical protein
VSLHTQKKLDTPQRTDIAPLLPVPDVFQDRREGSDTDTGTNKDSSLTAEEILSRGAVRAIDPNSGQFVIREGGVNFDEVSTAD